MLNLAPPGDKGDKGPSAPPGSHTGLTCFCERSQVSCDNSRNSDIRKLSITALLWRGDLVGAGCFLGARLGGLRLGRPTKKHISNIHAGLCFGAR